MRLGWGHTSILLALAIAVASPVISVAQDAQPPERIVEIKNPEKYLRRQGPVPSEADQLAAREKAERQAATIEPDLFMNKAKPSKGDSAAETTQAVISGAWTVIPNTTPGAYGNVSFVRFPNGNTTATATYTVRLIGDDTGRDYGTATFNVPPRGSPQFSMEDLLRMAGGTSFDPAELNLTLYTRTSHYNTGYQHVYYNGVSDFFENMSVCSYSSSLDYRPLNSALVNIHSSILSSRFPSLVAVHNKNAFATTLRWRVYDSQTGLYRATLQFVASANSTYVFTTDEMERELGISPGTTVYHYNLVYDNTPSASPNALMSHAITNVRVYGSVLNLTTICSIDD